MKIAVIGAGAVGGYFGGRLALNGNDVVFLVRGKTLGALRSGPLRVESVKGDFDVKVQATDDPEAVGDVDVVLVAVKTWQVSEAASAIQKMPGRDSIIVPLQNGVESPAQLTAIAGPGRVAGGFCAIVAQRMGPGHIGHVGGEPYIAFGEIGRLDRGDHLEELRDAFGAAGVHCEIPADIVTAMWMKFLFITPWGSLGAITRLPVGPLRAAPESRAKLVQALHELAEIARARGIGLGCDSVDKTLAILDGLPEDTTASMQRDIMSGRPSELEGQTAAVVRFGKMAGVATPIHDSIYAELLPLERRARGLA
jgi:2-dehydropantoate 2-reductase